MINKTIYLAGALNRQAYTEFLSMWPRQNESATFWQGVRNDLKAKGVEGILVTVTHTLNGLTQSIKNVFPKADRKHLYNAPNKEMTEEQLNRFAEQRNHKDPYARQSWKHNSDELVVFFDFPLEIRKIIYTTNRIDTKSILR